MKQPRIIHPLWSQVTNIMKHIVTLLAVLLAATAAQAAEVGNLRCAYRESPLGVDSTKPCLSWMISEMAGNGGVRGQKQTAYQVLVASTPELLAKEKGDLWDSGKVDSDPSIQVAYAGKPLESVQQCFWKVRVWDRRGRPRSGVLLRLGPWGF